MAFHLTRFSWVPSLEDMTVQYPISVDEIAKVYGVGEGKAKKYGKEFAEIHREICRR